MLASEAPIMCSGSGEEHSGRHGIGLHNTQHTPSLPWPLVYIFVGRERMCHRTRNRTEDRTDEGKEREREREREQGVT